MTNKKKILVGLIAFFVVLMFLSLEIFIPPKIFSKQMVQYTVQKGMGLVDISGDLKRQGIIKNTTLFKTYAVVLGRGHKLQAGVY
mgnify:CR=1 FL=1